VTRVGTHVELSRREAYALCAGKEVPGLMAAETLLRQVYGTSPDLVTDPDENRTRGDFRMADGRYVEVKSQPICPDVFSSNIVEVCEIVGDSARDFERHGGGFSRLAEWLGTTEDRLSDRIVHVARDGSVARFGFHETLHFSLTSMAAADATVFVNPRPPKFWAYVYPREELCSAVRHAARCGLHRGPGRMHDDAFGVYIPVAKHVYWCNHGEPWQRWVT
jgi:hypothetical protein